MPVLVWVIASVFIRRIMCAMVSLCTAMVQRLGVPTSTTSTLSEPQSWRPASPGRRVATLSRADACAAVSWQAVSAGQMLPNMRSRTVFDHGQCMASVSGLVSFVISAQAPSNVLGRNRFVITSAFVQHAAELDIGLHPGKKSHLCALRMAEVCAALYASRCSVCHL